MTPGTSDITILFLFFPHDFRANVSHVTAFTNIFIRKAFTRNFGEQNCQLAVNTFSP